ncbi:MAG: AraC family transcriptional regulator [Eubacterium sp.]|nr:AraC family transcriptional regulator [Eubacterium sp.]
MEEHYCNPVAIQDIAEHLGLNRSYLHRIFKAFTGVPIQSYLLQSMLRLPLFKHF